MSTSTIYKTAVHKNKQLDFLNFLQELGISKEFIKQTEIRKDYCFYELDISHKDVETRLKLNNAQTSFL